MKTKYGKLNYKRVAKAVIIVALITLFIIFIGKLPRSYTNEYMLDNITILEEYDKPTGIYTFTIKKGKNVYNYAFSGKYKSDKKIVDSVKIKNNCISVKNKVKDFSFCYDKEGNEISSFYYDINKAKKKDSYKNIELYDLGNFKYYVWNYKELLSIVDNYYDNIKLFDNDVYSLNLVTKYDKYLVLPNYDSKYYFDKLFLINSKNDDIKELSLNKKIYFDSYFLGDYRKKLYIYDVDQSKEYTINLKNGRVDKVKYQILKNGTFEKTTKIKLDHKNLYFSNDEAFKYVVKNQNIYYVTPENNILLTSLNVDKYIGTTNGSAFFISGDTLYRVNIEDGVSKVMRYSEWNFNSKNVYIFAK